MQYPEISANHTTYSRCTIDQKRFIGPTGIYLIIIRNNNSIGLHFKDMTTESLLKSVEDAKYSCIDIISGDEYINFISKSKRYFVLQNDKIPPDFEDIAFTYHHMNVSFGFVNKSTYSIIFGDNKHGVTREYDLSVPLTQWVRSCMILKYKREGKKERKTDVNQTNLKILTLTALTNDLFSNATKILDKLKKTEYNEYISFNMSCWPDAVDLQKRCQISEDELMYVLTDNRNPLSCWIFPDMDVFSLELFTFYLNKGLRGLFEPNIKKVEFARNVPNPTLISVVFFENTNSYSSYYASLVFKTVINLMKNKPIKFLTYNQLTSSFPSYVPTLESFPSFVLWMPNDRRPHIFNQDLSVESLENWINTYLTEEYLEANTMKPSDYLDLLSSILGLNKNTFNINDMPSIDKDTEVENGANGHSEQRSYTIEINKDKGLDDISMKLLEGILGKSIDINDMKEKSSNTNDANENIKEKDESTEQEDHDEISELSENDPQENETEETLVTKEIETDECQNPSTTQKAENINEQTYVSDTKEPSPTKTPTPTIYISSGNGPDSMHDFNDKQNGNVLRDKVFENRPKVMPVKSHPIKLNLTDDL